MKRLGLVAVGIVASASLAWAAVATLSPPAIVWGSGAVLTPQPIQQIGYDSSSGQACIVGSTPTCQLAVSVQGGAGSTVLANQGSAGGTPWPVITGQTTPAVPDITTVATGGTPVNAFSAGHCAKGCVLSNPDNATQLLCANGVGTASGTHTNGSTFCLAAGQSTYFTPRTAAISVVSSDSSHGFGGEGYQ